MAMLIVDDDPEFLDMFCFAARRAGFDAVPARDAVVGLRQWQTKPTEVVLIDVDLPDASGWALAQHIGQSSTTPILLLTDDWSEADAIRGFALGVDDYVTKPCSLSELLWRIRTVLRRTEQATAALAEARQVSVPSSV